MPKKAIKRIARTFTPEGGGSRVYCYGETVKEAEAARTIRKQELAEGKKRITKQMLCRDWFTEFMATYREPVIVERSRKDERSLWKCHLNKHLGARTLATIKPLHCQSVLNIMADAGRKEKQIRKARILMKMLFRKAIENSLLIDNPADNLILPDCEEDGTHRHIDEHERALLLAACDILPYPHGLWAKIMLYCGARPDEPSRIYGRHIDVVNSRLWIDGSKNKQSKRWVPVPDFLMDDLKPYTDAPDDLVLKNKNGRSLTITNRRDMWDQLRKEMHILNGGEVDYGELRRVVPKDDGSWPYAIEQEFVPYCLRHTFCTDCAKAEIPLLTAAKWMGHKDTKMVERIYTHLDSDLFKRGANKLNSYHKRTLKTNLNVVNNVVKFPVSVEK